jgi:hypothetical protein
MTELTLDVRHDLKAYKKGLSRMQRKDLPKAISAALNRVATTVKGTTVKSIAKQIGLKQKDVKPAISLFKATRFELEARITARGRPLNLIRFTTPSETREKARRRGGVRARERGKLKTFRGTFIGNAGRTVFRRVGKRRLPIVGVTGGSIPKTMTEAAVKEAIDDKFRQRWPVEFDRTFRRFVLRAR